MPEILGCLSSSIGNRQRYCLRQFQTSSSGKQLESRVPNGVALAAICVLWTLQGHAHARPKLTTVTVTKYCAAATGSKQGAYETYARMQEGGI